MRRHGCAPRSCVCVPAAARGRHAARSVRAVRRDRVIVCGGARRESAGASGRRAGKREEVLPNRLVCVCRRARQSSLSLFGRGDGGGTNAPAVPPVIRRRRRWIHMWYTTGTGVCTRCGAHGRCATVARVCVFSSLLLHDGGSGRGTGRRRRRRAKTAATMTRGCRGGARAQGWEGGGGGDGPQEPTTALVQLWWWSDVFVLAC